MFKKVAASCLFLSMFTATSEAALLGVALNPFPDIGSGFISVNYNAGADQFTATGFALTFNDDGIAPNVNITGGSFLLTATVDGSGAASTGSLTIGGTAGAFGAPLLTGSLSAMGWSGTLNMFDFRFTVTGGSLANSYYGGNGATFGVILAANSGSFTGNWNTNFSNSGNGVSDTSTVPAPGAAALALMAVCIGTRRRRQD